MATTAEEDGPGPGRVPSLLEWARRHPLAATLAVTLLAAGYCQGHDWVVGAPGRPEVSLAWAVTTIVPWAGVWVLHPRLPAERGVPRAATMAALCLGALLLTALGRTLAFADAFSPATLSLAQEAHRVLPFALAATFAGWWIGSRAPAPALPFPPQAAGAPEVGAPEAGAPQSAPPVPDLTLPDGRRVGVAEIDWIGSAGNYVEVHAGAAVLLWRRPLREVEALLAPHGFLRIHRTALVARGRVARLDGTGVLLRCGTRLPVGRNHRAAVRAALG